MAENKGKFIVVEGLDGSGKTVQSRMLAEHLRRNGHSVNLSFEPTNGPIGSIIRQVLLGRIEVEPKTLAAMFAADRLDHVYNPVNGILKHIADGVTEICDRYDLTSYAYQTLIVDEDWVWKLNSQTIRPDLTIFLDVDPEECYRRLLRSQIDDEMFHDIEHLKEARSRYLEAISVLQERESIVIVKGSGDLNKVKQDVFKVVEQFLAPVENLHLQTYKP
jgi:dTMP kinase